MERLSEFSGVKTWQDQILAARDESKPTIVVCAGTGCRGCGAEDVVNEFRAKIAELGMETDVVFRETGCHGFCERGTLVVIRPKGIFYQMVEPKNVVDVLEKTVKGGEILEDLLYTDPATGKKITYEKDVPFYKAQDRIIFSMNGSVDPTNIEDYIALGGYQGLVKVLKEMGPEEVIEQVKKSGLRGRGGGGFPTGRKWETCRNAHGDNRYVICNADEGDPGAYMDRSLLEGNPHLVLEGMIIGAYAIGSSEGYIYVRNEYPLAVKHTYMALEQAEKYGFLGDNILGTDFSFNIKVNRGGGAFVCGESTALMLSLEGKPGRPRAKYIHTVHEGYHASPTNLNNVETWANVPLIMRKGADWFSKIGTEKSTGTKVFSLVGKINNTGLVEVPMGMTLRELIFDIGGGILDGKKFKAVQTGGPSGGCLPESSLDLSLDFDTLTQAGSMMGSGGLIVMDESTCMVDVARYFIDFLKDESCGKCVPCREGVKRMLEILTKITTGKAEMADLDLLEELAVTIQAGSLCALGSTAPNPVLSTIKYFRDEYVAHIEEKKCPAGVCKELITYTIDPDACSGCLLCKKNCPEQCISGEKKKPHVIDQDKCIKCGVCKEVCPTKFDAVRVS